MSDDVAAATRDQKVIYEQRCQDFRSLNESLWSSGAFQRSLPGVSKKMLTQTLRGMEEVGPITRHVQSAFPPAVEYGLTSLSRRFGEQVELLYAWGRDNADALDELGSRSTARRL